jgi:hypothetical protein
VNRLVRFESVLSLLPSGRLGIGLTAAGVDPPTPFRSMQTMWSCDCIPARSTQGTSILDLKLVILLLKLS